MSRTALSQWIPSSPLYWLAYAASLVALSSIASNLPAIATLPAMVITVAMWAWLAREKREIGKTKQPNLDEPALIDARRATSAQLKESIKHHLIPASESLIQMSSVVTDGTQLLQQSFIDLASKSEKQLQQLNIMLSQLKGGDSQSDTLMIERFARQVAEMVEEMSSLEMQNATHAKHTRDNMDSMLNELMEANYCITGTIDSTSTIAKEMHQDVSTAVTAMQFEDSATQIAHYIQAQLQNAQASMEILQQELVADSDITHCLQQIEQRLKKQQTTETHQAVTAKNMQAGDIDLF